MANAAAKKRAAAFYRALLQYGGVGAASNLLFFFLRFWVLSLGLTSREWFLLAVTELTLLLSSWSLVETAADFGRVAGSSLDFFGIACATLLLSSFWGKGWWLLVGVPAYLTYQYGGFVARMLGLDKGVGAQAAGGGAPANAPPSSGGRGGADSGKAGARGGASAAGRKVGGVARK